MSDAAPILIIRAGPINPHFYDVILDWIKAEHAALWPCFEMVTLPASPDLAAGRKVLVCWFQDPTDIEAPHHFQQASEFGEVCRGSGGLVVNGVDRQENLSKLNTDARLAPTGVRTPRVAAAGSPSDFRSRLHGLEFPFLLRENVGHQRDFHLIACDKDLELAPIEHYDDPVVSEYIETRSADGLYRKYRSFAIGDTIITHHLQMSEDWLTRGSGRVQGLTSREQEIEFLISADSFEESLIAARRALDVEYVAFDYGVLPSGEPVIWEANQYAFIHFSTSILTYRNFAMDRTIAAIVLYYLTLAGIEPPAKLVRQASYED